MFIAWTIFVWKDNEKNVVYKSLKGRMKTKLSGRSRISNSIGCGCRKIQFSIWHFSTFLSPNNLLIWRENWKLSRQWAHYEESNRDSFSRTVFANIQTISQNRMELSRMMSEHQSEQENHKNPEWDREFRQSIANFITLRGVKTLWLKVIKVKVLSHNIIFPLSVSP